MSSLIWGSPDAQDAIHRGDALPAFFTLQKASANPAMRLGALFPNRTGLRGNGDGRGGPHRTAAESRRHGSQAVGPSFAWLACCSAWLGVVDQEQPTLLGILDLASDLIRARA